MLSPCAQRNIVLVATAVALAIGAAAIVWDALRSAALPAVSTSALLPEPRINLETISKVIENPQFRALVPLTPPVQPVNLGNPNPFPGGGRTGSSR